MKTFYSTERITVFLFFISAIVVGTLLLNLPISWNAPAQHGLLDAMFTSVSAICVVGLSIINVSELSSFGTVVLLILIQMGGLGIVTIYSLYLIMPDSKVSLRSAGLIQEYFVSNVEHKPRQILFYILVFTLSIELIGAIVIYFTLLASGYEETFFYAFFHSVSAFCNAGFSLNDNSLEGWKQAPLALVFLSFLIFLGGLGFVVIRDLVHERVSGKRLNLHTRVVIRASLFLIAAGFLLFFLIEFFFHQENPQWGDVALNSFFLSVSSRTAGFNYTPMDQISPVSQLITIILMFIGGSSGSAAGGVKTTTIVLFFFFLLKGDKSSEGFRLFNRQIPTQLIHKAVLLVLRFFLILVVATMIMFLIERPGVSDFSHLQLFFEVASALGTVGLSTGITAQLSLGGKILIMVVMFIGRVGLIAFALDRTTKKVRISVKYPEGEVLVG